MAMRFVAYIVMSVTAVYIVVTHSLLAFGVPLYWRDESYTAVDYIRALPFCLVYILLAGRVLECW